ncbi:MAG: bi-domain-containing oxidoreductase [Candidatus Obscuribacterales bacterium]|nr:bi-domain-containing oxidoreductase [Candidatus Obscuribacterales bacterium]
MKQIIQSARTGKLTVKDVPVQKVKSGCLLVQSTASLISAGTERMVVQFAKKNLADKAKSRPDLVRKVFDKLQRDGLEATIKAVLARLDEPLPLGYSACGNVLEVGPGMEGQFHVGQRVAIAGAGIANHAGVNLVPRNLVAPVPHGVSDEEASFATLASISLHGVRNANVALGDRVAILGMGLVGQLCLQLAVLSGARVVALDYNPARLELAERLGAEFCCNLSEGTPVKLLNSWSSFGCDSVIVAAATESSAPLETAGAIARDRAKIILVGNTGTTFPLRDYMKKELSLIVSRSYGPGRYDNDYERRGLKYPEGWVRWTETENLEEVLRLMSPDARDRKKLNVKELVTHRFDFERCLEAYDLVVENREPHLGVILQYNAPVKSGPVIVKPDGTGRVQNVVRLGVIGAGSFAKTILLPEFRANSKCVLDTIVTQRGSSSQDSQERFGFQKASADIEDIFSNNDINAVLVVTPPGNHADLVKRALAAGKSVLVEKPLCLSREELNSIVETRNESQAFFQVGFNRRFAPAAKVLRDRLSQSKEPKFILMRVNAGALDEEVRQAQYDDNHGRIMGELCHFIDLCRFLAGCTICSVSATSARSATSVSEDLSVSLKFADGSLATIAYTAMGDTSFGKELVECYVGGQVLQIEDFRKSKIVTNGKVINAVSYTGQDKGHKAEVQAFLDAVQNGTRAPIDEQELVETTQANLACLESLRSGQTILL